LLAIGLGTLLVSSAAGWAKKPPAPAPAETFGVEGPVMMHKAQKPIRPTPSEQVGVDPVAVPEVRLQALDTDALLREDALAERQARVKALRYGVGRDVQVSAKDGNWYDLADGARLWVGEVVSTDALGLRLHFKDVRLPAGAQLAVYAPAGSDPARGVVKSGSSRFDPDRTVEFHNASAMAKAEFWTGTIVGDRTRIEYLSPAGAASDELPFAVDRLQHLYLDPVDKLAKDLMSKRPAGACNNDVSCYPEWGDVARAVSGIGFIGSDSLFCTGQLLNNLSTDFTPYWLTANHCLETSGEAGSSEFFWLYQTSSCNGTPPSIGNVPRSVGATLVSTNSQSDYTLLQVEGALPAGLYWAGWTSASIADGTDAVAIHHPQGDYKRLSFGFKDEGSQCSSIPGFGGRSLVRISWTDGPTEPGSSGSGIFRADTGQLFGQLLGGPSACGNETFDCYGAFATTYTRTKNFLKGGTDDTSEQNDSCSKARVVKAGTLRGRIVKVNDTDWYRVSVPARKTLTVRLSFGNGNGDIDLAAFANCAGGDPLTSSTSTEDSEEFSVSNVGNKPAFAYWQVYLDSDTRNSYDMTVSLH
jgi:hypothetical protein